MNLGVKTFPLPSVFLKKGYSNGEMRAKKTTKINYYRKTSVGL